MISALFSPGTHLEGTTVAIAIAFLALRVGVVLLWPAALISLALWTRAR
jgi:hypothetical protein